MNQENPLSDNAWLAREIGGLQSEKPAEEAILAAVNAVQSTVPSRPRKFPVRVALPIGAVALVAGLIAFRAPDVSAAELHRLADAARRQRIRHSIDLRPDSSGNLVLANEFWVEGDKMRMVLIDAAGKKMVSGYDGKMSFRYLSGEPGSLDDTAPSGIPVETIEDYLAIPNARVIEVRRGVREGGLTADIFTIGYGGVIMDLVINPSTGLPVRRVVRSAGGLIEENRYDYPADIDDSIFRPSAEEAKALTDYPLMRNRLAAKLAGSGQTKELGGVKITLRAVIVGHRQVVALWSGGARTDFDAKGHIHIAELAPGYGAGLSGASVWDKPAKDRPLPTVDGRPLLGDAVWYEKPIAVQAPFDLIVPVWIEDRSRPLVTKEGETLPGYHSKLLGQLRFRVNDPIFAEAPERVLWRPSEGVGQAAAAN